MRGRRIGRRATQRMADSNGGPPAFVAHRLARVAAISQPDAAVDARGSERPVHGRGAMRAAAVRSRATWGYALGVGSSGHAVPARVAGLASALGDGADRAAVPEAASGSAFAASRAAAGAGGSGAARHGAASGAASPFAAGALRPWGSAPGVRARSAVLGAQSRRTLHPLRRFFRPT